MTHRLAACVTALTIGAAGPTVSQQPPPLRLRVALLVAENTGGLFASAFGAALRSLGDVDVVGEEEAPDFVLRVAVLCIPSNNCAGAVSYSVAYSATRRLTRNALEGALLETKVPLGPRERGQATDELWRNFKAYERPLDFHEAQWGRDRYEGAVRAFVAHFDHACLEHHRLGDRWVAAMGAGDTVTANAVFRQIEAGEADTTSAGSWRPC